MLVHQPVADAKGAAMMQGIWICVVTAILLLSVSCSSSKSPPTHEIEYDTILKYITYSLGQTDPNGIEDTLLGDIARDRVGIPKVGSVFYDNKFVGLAREDFVSGRCVASVLVVRSDNQVFVIAVRQDGAELEATRLEADMPNAPVVVDHDRVLKYKDIYSLVMLNQPDKITEISILEK